MMWINYKYKRSPKRFFMFLFFVAAAVFVLGAIVMFLWNAILPSLLNVNNITYWQAVGLVILCKILFSGFRPGRNNGGPPFGRSHLKDKWASMTEEEKIKFKEEWKKRCERRKE